MAQSFSLTHNRLGSLDWRQELRTAVCTSKVLGNNCRNTEISGKNRRSRRGQRVNVRTGDILEHRRLD